MLGSARYFRSHLSHRNYCIIVSHHRLYRTSISFIRTDVKEKEREREREREKKNTRRKKQKSLSQAQEDRDNHGIISNSKQKLFSSSSPFAREERDERKMARCRVPYYKYAKRTRVGSFVSNFSSEPQRSFVITSPPQNTSNRGRESKNDTYSLSIIAE